MQHIRRAPTLGGPDAAHLAEELALLHAAPIAIGEVDTWGHYAADRPNLISPPSASVTDAADVLRETIGYSWFLGGHPQAFDRCQEANRRAHPLLVSAQPPTVRPDDLPNDGIGSYPDPMDRLRRLHVGEQELMTGFGFGPSWPCRRW